MKKFLTSLALALLAVFSVLPCAYAEEYVPLGSYTAGEKLNCYISNVDAGAQVVSLDLPTGCSLVDDFNGGTRRLLLGGAPTEAGQHAFSIQVSGVENYTINCSIDLTPALPSIQTCQDVTCAPGSSVLLSVSAWTTDGGSLSYQWYTGVGFTSIPINGATDPVYSPDTSVSGTTYYTCSVTNTNNGLSVSAMSEPIVVTVATPKVVSISVDAMPSTTRYQVGDSLNLSGMRLQVNYDNGSSEIVSQGYTGSPSVFNEAGTQTVTISYGGAVCYFYVTVENKEAVVDGIGVVTLPKKTQYKVGDNLETEGLSIRAYSGNTHFVISSGLDCSPTVLNTAGSQTITVTYAGKTCTFTVKVAEEKEVIQTVTVAARPTKVEYTVGDRLDSTGLTLRVVTNKGTKEVTSGFSCSPKVLTTAGTQTVTVAYGQYTCTFDVTVKAAASPSPSPTPTPTPSASPAVSASPSAGPGAVSPSPSAGRHDNGSNPVSAVVKVGLIVAVLALAGLAGCVYVLQKKGNVDFLSMFTGKNKQDRGRH